MRRIRLTNDKNFIEFQANLTGYERSIEYRKRHKAFNAARLASVDRDDDTEIKLGEVYENQ